MSKNTIVFTVNGKRQEVSTNVDCRDSLNDYIRRNLNLTGTKVSCREGGCGVCIVNVKEYHPVTSEEINYSINSCLVSPFSCHGKDITTIEGLGNKLEGYHSLQTRLARFNASQCGFCSPGFIMSMYSILHSSKPSELTMNNIETQFGSNLCRCTGYRPIADAMKSFATDAGQNLRQQIKDIEDINKINICSKICSKPCSEFEIENEYCILNTTTSMEISKKEIIMVDFGNYKWYKVFNAVDLLKIIFYMNIKDTYMFVAGNTAKGVYPLKSPANVFIDISSVQELRTSTMGTNLEIGGGMTLSEVMNLFKNISKQNDFFSYTREMADHLEFVAHTPVRNIGTIAGNLSIKQQYNEFPSDVFLMFETVGAFVTFGNNPLKNITSLSQYLKSYKKGQVIWKVELPPLSKQYIFKTYKAMSRAQNANAIVNAGFLIKLKSESSSIIENARIVFGNISKSFIHAFNTEKYLANKNLYDPNVLKGAINVLIKEVNPVDEPQQPSPQYRKLLAIALYYKFILNMLPRSFLNTKYRSGGTMLTRPLSSGRQVFDTNASVYPLNQPVIKIEAQVQCSGEAEYVNDILPRPGELHATFVLSTIPKGTLVSVDISAAMKVNGVVAIYTAADIPGINSFVPVYPAQFAPIEEILVSIGGKVFYYNQPIAVVVATNTYVFKKAVPLVKATYSDIVTSPVLTIQEALRAPASDNRVTNDQVINASRRGTEIVNIFNGHFETNTQYHFHLETQSCLCVPNEDSINVYSASQWLDQIGGCIATSLDVPENSINVVIRRLGGSYGGKLSRAGIVACACALAAKKLNRPVRFILPFETNMRAIGKRNELACDYEVAVNKDGLIQYLTNTFYNNNGYSPNESTTTVLTLPAFLSGYDTSTWTVSANGVLTDKASNTFIRAPGTAEGFAMIENIMDRIAFETGSDPVAVRIANLTPENPLRGMIIDHLATSEYYSRLNTVNIFNLNNRWKKKGIHLSIMQYSMDYFGNFAVVVSIYRNDGTVAVEHSGIEMGQGINTKIAQVVSYTLGVPLDRVAIKPSTNFVTPNALFTGNSMASDLCCYSAIQACEILNARLRPIRNTLTDPTWRELISTAYLSGVDLNATYMYSVLKDSIGSYPIYGVCVSEIELDVLTGNHIITRVDILEDTGESMSPLIDIGQVEGAFTMGIGLWTMENLVYDTKGEVLTDNTWNYKVPGMKDIPVDFRVYFRRNAPNPLGVVRSKATGEPPMTLAFSVAEAIRHAVTSARSDAKLDTKTWFEFEYPLTTEHIFQACGTDPVDFKLK